MLGARGVGRGNNILAIATPKHWAGKELIRTVGDPLTYQDGGDNECGVEQTV